MSSSAASVVRLEPIATPWPRWLGAAVGVALLLAALGLSALPWWWAAAVLAAAWWLLRPGPIAPHWLLAGRRVERAGDPAGADLRGFAMLGPLLSLQLVHDTGRSESLLFGPWNLDAEQRRLLRLHLRRLQTTG